MDTFFHTITIKNIGDCDMATKRTATNRLVLASAQVASAQSALLERFQTSLKPMILLDLFEIFLG
jgi:hypothetical protein